MKALLVLCLLMLCGCAAEPMQRENTDNPQVQVEDLFTKDGYTVHRFYDGGTMRAVYYVTPVGVVQQPDEVRHSGKTTYVVPGLATYTLVRQP
jgi:hypothetical protein